MSNLETNPAADASTRPPPAPVVRPEHAEGALARIIEQQAAKVPSHWFLMAAAGAMVASLGFELAGRKDVSRFIAAWPGPLLIAGTYNKLVKTLGTR